MNESTPLKAPLLTLQQPASATTPADAALLLAVFSLGLEQTAVGIGQVGLPA